MITNYKKLLVWQKSISLVKEIYVILGSFPKTETYGLCDQIKRSAISIPSNIAEGSQRNGETNEFKHFLFIAKGSAAELETQIILSFELGFISKDNFEKISFLIEEVLKMTSALISSLKTKD